MTQRSGVAQRSSVRVHKRRATGHKGVAKEWLAYKIGNYIELGDDDDGQDNSDDLNYNTLTTSTARFRVRLG
jgi:hypothetical protein